MNKDVLNNLIQKSIKQDLLNPTKCAKRRIVIEEVDNGFILWTYNKGESLPSSINIYTNSLAATDAANDFLIKPEKEDVKDD